MRRSSLNFIVAVSSVLLIAACSGGDDDKQAATAGPTPVPAAGTPSDAFPLLTCNSAAKPAATETRRLTKTEYSNTLRDLLGASTHDALAPMLAQLPDDDISGGLNRFANRYTADHARVFTDIAFDAASRATETDAQLDTLLTAHSTCTTANITAACARTFIRNFGLRAWRRPLTNDEATWVEAAYNTGIDARDSFAIAIATLISAPDLAYHWEFGTPGGADNEYEITQYEVASRLSFALWSAPPSADLLQKASRNELSDPAALQSTVAQMMNDPRARAKVHEFFEFWLKIKNAPGVPDNPNIVAGLLTDGLRDEGKRELLQFVDSIVAGGGGYRDLLTSQVSYARTPALAQIYGHTLASNPDAGTQRMASGRMGLLSRLPWLSTSDNSAKTIVRGARMLEHVLCTPPGIPDAAAFAATTDIQTASLTSPARDRVHARTGQAPCSSCHQKINPLGFVMENFGPFGEYRTTERVWGSTHDLLATHAINASVSNLQIDRATGENAANAAEFMQLVAGSHKGPLCMAQQLHRFYQMRMESFDNDACSLLDTKSALTENSIRQGIVKSVAGRALKLKVVAP
ncbi:MAG: DUF1592 domain-containing protein [Burkholderiaceae bacterium]